MFTFKSFINRIDPNRKFHLPRIKVDTSASEIFFIMSGSSLMVMNYLALLAKQTDDSQLVVACVTGYDRAGIYAQDLEKICIKIGCSTDAFILLGLNLKLKLVDKKVAWDLVREDTVPNMKMLAANLLSASKANIKAGFSDEEADFLNEAVAEKINNDFKEAEKVRAFLKEKNLDPKTANVAEVERMYEEYKKDKESKTKTVAAPRTVATGYRRTSIGPMNFN